MDWEMQAAENLVGFEFSQPMKENFTGYLDKCS